MHIALDYVTMTFITNNVILGYGKFEMLKVSMPALVLTEYYVLLLITDD